MLKAILCTSALVMLPFAGMAETRIVDGCEVIKAENGDYWYKTDGACEFARIGLGSKGDGPFPLPVPPLPGDDDDGSGDDDGDDEGGGNPCGGNCGNGKGNGGGNGTGDEGQGND